MAIIITTTSVMQTGFVSKRRCCEPSTLGGVPEGTWAGQPRPYGRSRVCLCVFD